MELVLYPDPILRKRASPQEVVDEEVREQATKMFEIMYRENGVGLAAPQVGWSTRLFVMNPQGADQPEGEQVFVNPRILDATGEELDEEGCLSMPEVRGEVLRNTWVQVEAQALSGETFQQELRDLPARVFQHEYDHLDGILFISRLSETEKLTVKKALKRLEKEYRQKVARR